MDRTSPHRFGRRGPRRLPDARGWLRAGPAWARGLFALTLAAALVAPAAGRGEEPEPAPVALHPALGDTVSAAEAARCGLFADVAGLEAAVFRPAPWGGYLVRLRTRTGATVLWRERNVSSAAWRQWRAQVEACLAGEHAPPPAVVEVPATGAGSATGATGAGGAAVADSVGGAVFADSAGGAAIATGAGAAIAPGAGAAADGAALAAADRPPPPRPKVWPEAPLPAPRPRPAVARDSTRVAAYPPLQGRWLVAAALGYRHCLTGFREFFTDMGLFELMVQNRATRRLTPYFAFQIGFGDIPDEFESVVTNPDGSPLDGRSALYALELGSLLTAGAGEHSDVYVGLGWGYYMRSLRWGTDATFVDIYGNLYTPTLVRELQDWGVSTRLGWRKQYRTIGGRVRMLDIQARWENYAASTLSAEPSLFRASGRDQWIALSVSLVGGF